MSYFPLGSGSGGVWTSIETVTVSNQATVEMDLSGTYKMYQIVIDNLIPIDDEVELWLRFSTDGGSTFLSGASDYAWSYQGGSDFSVLSGGDAADAQIVLTASFGLPNMGTGTAEAYNSIINIHNPNQTTRAVCTNTTASYLEGDTGRECGYGTRGALIANIDEVDAIQLLGDTGNLDSGRITLFGLGLS